MTQPGEPRKETPEDLVPAGAMWLLTALFVVLAIAATDVLLSIWPAPMPAGATAGAVPDSAARLTILWGQLHVTATTNDRLMLVAILMGVIGAMVHAMTSFADFVGNKRLEKSWLPWYFLRPLIGGHLGVQVYGANEHHRRRLHVPARLKYRAHLPTDNN